MSKKSDWYLVEPFEAGELFYKDPFSSPTFIVDTISRDGIIYFNENGYLITPALFQILKQNNLVGVNIDLEPDAKFSVQHNMKYPNQSLPQWHRMIPFILPEDGSMREIYLDSRKNLIISERIKNVLDKAVAEKKIRLKRVKFHPYQNKEEEEIEEANTEKEVFKEEKESPIKGIIIFLIVMSAIAYWFFK